MVGLNLSHGGYEHYRNLRRRGALFAAVPNPLPTGSPLTGLVAFYTLFVCVIALPHVVVGDWLDPERGIWFVP